MFHIGPMLGLALLASSSSATEPACSETHLAHERVRITRHLTEVEGALRAVDTSYLDDAVRAKRARLLDALRDYTAGGVFPQNDVTQSTTPIFVDGGGRTCAVAELLMRDGRRDIVREVVRRENLARVPVMQTESLLAWAATSGFTVDELARIQPAYNGCGQPFRIPACISEPCQGPPDACDDFIADGFNPAVCDDVGQVFANECIAETCMTPGATEEKCDDGQGCSTLHGAPSTMIAWGALALVLLARRRRR